MMSNQIPGVPDGWEAVSFDYVSEGEHWLDEDGDPIQRTSPVRTQCKRLIIRKIEKPATYRPFKDAEEFKPHRDRWWMLRDLPSVLSGPRGNFIEPPEAYAEKGFAGCDWKSAFELRVFDDGTPFGVRIDE